MSHLVRVHVQQGIAEVSLQRPAKRNALSRAMLEELLGVIRDCRQDSETRGLVLAADGPVFCAGMDLAEMEARAQSADGAKEWLADSHLYAEVLRQLVTAPFPTIASVQGPALAGGVGLVLACDLVVACQGVFFALPEPSRGIVAAMVTPLLVRRIGCGPASAMLLSCEQIDTAAAQRWGLCHDVVAADMLPTRTRQLAHSIRQGAPEALATTKSFLHRCAGDELERLWEQAIHVSATARESDAAREGLQAFLERRKPHWQE